ncbi:hypothetical protein LDENG_00080230 [Lucifuga dentata]|nr:hypothetical protein LDENG_00080230 [Lucifuga dentata]
MKIIIHAFISSRLDYCNSLFTCLNKTSLHRLQTVQNAAVQLLTKYLLGDLIFLLFYLHFTGFQFILEFILRFLF